ncbi:MAG: thioredoxin family protein [Armatimonadetes bacterium]|nr:thioredoxin family protein [Armatimonadota bacterium]
MKRSIEIITAGCPICEPVVEQVRQQACPSCEVTVLDLRQPDAARRARELGVSSLPSVAIDGLLAGCCHSRGVDFDTLRAAGLGQPGAES